MGIGYTSKFYHGTAGAAAASITTEITKTFKLKPPALKTGKVESTNNDSVSGVKEYDIGLIDQDELDCACRYVKATYTALQTLVHARAKVSFKITYPDSSTWHGDGWISDLDPVSDLETQQDINFKVQPAGIWAFTAAT